MPISKHISLFETLVIQSMPILEQLFIDIRKVKSSVFEWFGVFSIIGLMSNWNSSSLFQYLIIFCGTDPDSSGQELVLGLVQFSFLSGHAVSSVL